MAEGQVVAVPRDAGRERCPYCRDGLGDDAAGVFECPGCATRVHADCRREAGRCTTAGCAGPPPGRAAEAARVRAAEEARSLEPIAAGVVGPPGCREFIALVLGGTVGVVALVAGVVGGLAAMWNGWWVTGLALVTAGIGGGPWGGVVVHAVVLGERVPRFREVVR